MVIQNNNSLTKLYTTKLGFGKILLVSFEALASAKSHSASAESYWPPRRSPGFGKILLPSSEGPLVEAEGFFWS